MPEQDAAGRFEAALIDTVNELRLPGDEPALVPFVVLLSLLNFAADEDEHRAKAAESILVDLHRAYEWARSHDANWPEWLALAGRDGSPIDLRTGAAPPSRPAWQPKRVYKLEREHLPPELEHTYGLARLLWPILPLVNFLHYTRGSTAWTPEEKKARVYEYAFVLLCTKPKKMRPFLYDLARAVITRMRRQFPGLDRDKIDDAAAMVADKFERRQLAVSRYRARATSIRAAAAGVRQYMEAAIRRRAKDVIREILDPSFTTPASTLRRWRQKCGISVESPEDAEHVRKQMKAHRDHSPPDRISVTKAARLLKRARSTTTNALRIAEAKHGFTAERGPDGTIGLTHQQVRWLSECLPPARSQRRRQPPLR